MDSGDFDVTPAPSGRPSRSDLRPGHGHASPETLASPPGAPGLRHPLLKASASGPMLVDRDLSAQSGLDQAPVASDTMPLLQAPALELENKPAATPTPSSPLSTAPRLVLWSGNGPLSSSKLLVHGPSSRLLSPVAAPTQSNQSWSPTVVASIGDSASVSTGRSSSPRAASPREFAHATASRGDLKRPAVANGLSSAHVAHARVSKVRPAFHYPAHHPVITGQAHGLHYRPSRNKVGPFDAGSSSPTWGNEQLDLLSPSSTAVSVHDMDVVDLRDSPPPSTHATTVSDTCRGRFPKVKPHAEFQEPSLDRDASRITSLATPSPSQHFAFPTSKARPFATCPDRPNHASSHPVHESKARLMAESPHERTQRKSIEDYEVSPPRPHATVRVPVSKAKPFIYSPHDDFGSHHAHHHHLAKAQPFTGQGQLAPSAFPPQDALDQCGRCQIPEDAQNACPVNSIAPMAQEPATDIGEGFPPEQVSGKHSISACDEYATYSSPEPHSVDACQRFGPHFGQGSRQAIEQQGQPIISPSFPASPDHQDAQASAFVKDEGSSRSSRGVQAREADTPSADLEHGFATSAVLSAAFPAVSNPSGVTGQSVRGPTLVHAPVPISKLRPAFYDHGFVDHASHTPVSKARVAHDHCVAPTPRGDQVLGPESEKLQGEHENLLGEQAEKAADSFPSRRQSLGSVLEYKRTAHWLRGVLSREGYSTKFTERPAKKRASHALPGQRRKSDSMLSSILSARHSRRNSRQSTRKGAKFDGLVFSRAVNDLEKLLNEALALASHVVDRPEPPAHKERETPSPSPGPRSIIRGTLGPKGSLGNRTPERVQEEAGSMEEVDLDKAARPKRPTCRHAATYWSLPRRPGLNEIIGSYSGEDFESKPRKSTRNLGHANKAFSRLAVDVPCRDSSRHMRAHALVRSKGDVDGDRSREISTAKTRHDGSPNVTMGVAVQQKSEARPQLARPGAGGVGKAVGRRVAARGGPAAEESMGEAEDTLPERDIAGHPMRAGHGISLHRRSHVSLRDSPGFDLANSRRRQPTARDWSPIRKRFAAAVACISTALIGIILGIYAGLVPSIQYYIIDQSHATVHGNTGCFLGLAVPTFFLWPLPLLHGRRRYILGGLVAAMPMLFFQSYAVSTQKLTSIEKWRAMLVVTRTLMGFSLGLASMNFHSILMDLFGASLMSVNPHQEVVDQYDARRHGGGMGVWLGIWTWCWIGSLGIGFLVGACIIDSYPPAWGFYVSIILILVVLLLNIVGTEVRRSAYRRCVAEVWTGSDVSRRIAKGEIMMHRVKTGPKWWGQEVYHGIALCLEMLRQPGFAVMAVYSAWIYAQVVLIIVLLGSLTSRLYQLRSPAIGLLVGSVALGAFLAIPFQKANLFSRSRQAQMNSNLATLNRKVAWSSHLVRRTIFVLLLPIAGIGHAAVSKGPPVHVSIPTLFAGLVGFFSCLGIAECNGLVMETFDCSDLSSGMVGRQRGGSEKDQQRRINYSSFPRVTAGFATIHGLAFVLAAGATALGGLVTRTLGQQVAAGVVAGILFLLSMMLLAVLVRFANVQIIPQCKAEEMDKLVEARRRSSTRRASMPNDPMAIMEEEIAWRPAMIGNPTGKKRRMNILELGGLSRWNEVRKKNKLIDEGVHLNRAALDQGWEALDDQVSDLQRDAREFLGMSSGSGKGGRRLRRTDEGSETADESMEMDNMETLKAKTVQSGRVRRHPGRCAMSRTSEEEYEDEGRRARRRH